MLESDVIVFACPVYMLNLSEIMKNFIDCLAYYSHPLNLSGKLGFTVTTTLSGGGELVSDLLQQLQIFMGTKKVNNFVFKASYERKYSMIGNKIFLDRSIETEVTVIIDEILKYIDDNLGEKTPIAMHYYSILLFVSELLPHMKQQDKWIGFGYDLCKIIKQGMESYGCFHETGMFTGLGYPCFVVNTFCKQANILQGFAHSMNKVLLIATAEKLKQIRYSPSRDANHDMINGISGTLYYLLDCDCTQDEKKIITNCIEYLLELTKNIDYNGKTVIKFHVLQPDQNPNYDQEDYKDGSINLGLAHGMLGPLIALAKAHSRGFSVDGLRDGIEKIYLLYETFKSVNEDEIPLWPGKLTVEEYVKGVCLPEHLHEQSSWCYGNIGIIRGLQKVSGYMKWREREVSYIEAMKAVLAQDLKQYKLFSPSLCHGYASLVAIQTCAYSTYADPELLIHLERNVRQVITEYRKNNEQELSLEVVFDKRNPVEGYMSDLSLLTGSVSVAITLLSLNGRMEASKLLMID